MPASRRPFIVGSAVLVLLACACEDPPEGVDPRAETSPVQSVTCTRQNAETAAGGDADSTDEPDGCTETTASDSGDGDTADVQITELGDGVFAIDLESVEIGGDDPDPIAYVEIEITLLYGAGGEWLTFAALDASEGEPAFVVAECDDEDGSVPVVFRSALRTKPEGGSLTCTVTAGTPRAGTYRVLAGANLAPECAPSGCEETGTFGSFEYFCRDRDDCFCDSFPTPCFCRDCSVVSADLTASVSGSAPGNDILISADGTLRCDGCTAAGVHSDWQLVCAAASCVFETDGSATCDETVPDACDLRIGDASLGDPLIREQIFVDRDAFHAPTPLAGTIDKAMTESSGDGIFSFTLETAGREVEAEIATDGGAGTSSAVFVFDGAASITENPTPGFQLVGHDCPGDGPTATLTESRTCEFLNEQLEVEDLVPIGVTGAETFSPLPASFGPVTGSYFAVHGDNGFAVYDAATFGLVPSLSRVGGFLFTNVLGALWIDDPLASDDWLSGWNQGSGSFQTLWVSENNDFGATLLGFGAVFDGVHRDGDPNADTALQVTTSAVRRLFFDDFGGETNFLTSATHVDNFDLASGFAAATAFLTSGSDEVLIAARSTTAGQPGRAFRADSTTGFAAAIASGDLGVDPRLLRCASADPPTQVCVVTPFASTAANVLLWTPGVGAVVVDSIPTGAGPLGLEVFAAGEAVRAAITNFEDDTLTLAALDGTTGAVLGSTTQSLPLGCTEPSNVHAPGDGRLLVLCNGATAGPSAIAIVENPAFP